MKSKLALSLMTAYLLTGCVKYASGYNRSGGGGSADSESAADGSSSEGDSDASTEEGSEDTAGESGDESTGEESLSLLSNCEGCHNSEGTAKSVTLDSTAVSRLDEAYSGKNKSNHTTVETYFVEPDRETLESELNSIGLRLKDDK